MTFVHLCKSGTIYLLLCVCLTGCSTINKIQKGQEEKKEAIETKKQLFVTLKSDISNKVLRKGSMAEDIKTKYGPPDDIFYSGSSEGSFQVWTYNVYKKKLDDNKLDVVILYIENDKLVNWKF